MSENPNIAEIEAETPGALAIASSKIMSSQTDKKPVVHNPFATFSSMSELKEKEPAVYNWMMKMIAQNLVSQLKHRQDDLIKQMKEIRRQGAK